MKSFLVGVLALMLLSCSPTLPVNGTVGPLAGTTIDEVALRGAWLGYGFALNEMQDRMDDGRLVKGSPEAKAIADTLDRVLEGLKAASAAQRAGNSGDLLTALSEATSALDRAKAALQ